MAASRSLEKRLKSRHAAEMNACRVVAVCHSPEPFHLTYLRERWQEAFEDGQDSADSSDEELNPLLLDPTQWKDQDHYVILGLGKLRYRASRDDIKRAYRQKVLTHHPDKQSEENQLKEGDDLFKCIKIGKLFVCLFVCLILPSFSARHPVGPEEEAFLRQRRPHLRRDGASRLLCLQGCLLHHLWTRRRRELQVVVAATGATAWR